MSLGSLCSLAGGLALSLTFLVPHAHGQGPAKPRLDLFGDPLPEHAIARLGCLRLRHPPSIEHLAFSPDGKRLASWTYRSARLWDVATGKLVHALPTRESLLHFHFAGFSPDGKWVAVGAETGVALYDPTSGKPGRIFELTGNSLGMMVQVEFTPDSKFMAAASSKYTDVWEVRSGKRLNAKLLAPKARWPLALHLATDGKILTVLSFEENNRFVLSWWDVADGRLRKKREGVSEFGMWHTTFSPDGTLLAFLAEDSLRVLDLATDKIVFQLPSKTQKAGPLSFSADGKLLLAFSDDQWIVWKTGTWDKVFAVPRAKEGRSLAALSPDGKMIATTEPGGSISLRNLATGKEHFPDRPPVTDLHEMVWASPTALVSRSRDSHSSVTRWDSTTGRWLGESPELPLEDSYEAALRPQGDLLALVGRYSLGIWDLHLGKEKRNLGQGHKEQYWCPTFSPDGTHIAAVGNSSYQRLKRKEWVDPTLRLWRVDTGKEVRSLALSRYLSQNLDVKLTLSPDNRTVLVQCGSLENRGEVAEWHFWNSVTGNLRPLAAPPTIRVSVCRLFPRRPPGGRLRPHFGRG